MSNTEHQEQNYPTTHRFPSGVNADLSRRIAQRLAKGKIITKQVYDAGTSQLKSEKLYTALFSELDFYKEMYVHMGWNLIHCPDGEFFYLSKTADAENAEEGDANSLRVCVPLFYLAETVVRRGLKLEVLWTPHMGFSEDEISELVGDDAEKTLALEALKFRGNVWQDATKNLINKGFAYENSKGNLVFSSAAKHFTERMIEQFAD